MPFDFPASPLNGQQVTGNNGAIYTWNGTAWVTSPTAQTFVSKAGDTMTGPLVLSGNASSALQAVPLQQLQGADNPASNNAGRNLIHNPLFNVAQRGVGPWTANGAYTADRWATWFVGGSMSTSVNTANDDTRSQIGDESVQYTLGITCTGTSGAGDQSYFQQNIEKAQRISGKTITVSFWAATTSGTPKLGVNLYQVFGSGGSPSGAVVITGQAVTLSTTYTRYALTFSLPSTAGKTFGTNGDDSTILRFWMSAGANANAIAGNIGVQSYALGIWGVQLEIGSVATPLAKRDPADELALCQRFYSIIPVNMTIVAGSAGTFGYQVPFPTTMRAPPGLTSSGISYTNANTFSSSAPGPNGLTIWAAAIAAGTATFTATVQASADL